MFLYSYCRWKYSTESSDESPSDRCRFVGPVVSAKGSVRSHCCSPVCLGLTLSTVMSKTNGFKTCNWHRYHSSPACTPQPPNSKPF